MLAVTITKGQTTDIEIIAQFQVDMAIESEDTQLDKETVLKGVAAAMDDENKGCYYVARVEGEAVGSLMVTREWSDWNNGWYWWIQSVYVAPDYRRQGIYKSMYNAVCEDARQQNVAQVRLYVDKTNTSGQKVYASLGMQESHYLIYETTILKQDKNKLNLHLTKVSNNMEETPILNRHNKDEHAPAHTAEHLLNQTMIRMFGCERSKNAHIERKKSKINYTLPSCPTTEQVAEIERRMNDLIAQDLPVTFEFVTHDNLPGGVVLDKLPNDASETLRIVRIGDYDICACIGNHVASTKEIGSFKITSTSYNEGSFRIVYKVNKE